VSSILKCALFEPLLCNSMLIV